MFSPPSPQPSPSIHALQALHAVSLPQVKHWLHSMNRHPQVQLWRPRLQVRWSPLQRRSPGLLGASHVAPQAATTGPVQPTGSAPCSGDSACHIPPEELCTYFDPTRSPSRRPPSSYMSQPSPIVVNLLSSSQKRWRPSLLPFHSALVANTPHGCPPYPKIKLLLLSRRRRLNFEFQTWTTRHLRQHRVNRRLPLADVLGGRGGRPAPRPPPPSPLFCLRKSLMPWPHTLATSSTSSGYGHPRSGLALALAGIGRGSGVGRSSPYYSLCHLMGHDVS